MSLVSEFCRIILKLALVPYRVVENPLRLSEEEWDRVVAIFVMVSRKEKKTGIQFRVLLGSSRGGSGVAIL